MYFEQFYLGCLAHASYMLASEGEAVVVDPQRDVEIYLTAAEANQVSIRHIFETHLHADFVSGHRELASRTGARIYIGAQARRGFPSRSDQRWLPTASWKTAHHRSRNARAHAGEHVLRNHRRRKVSCALGRSNRRHAVPRRRRPSRSFQTFYSRCNSRECFTTACTTSS